MHINLLYTGWRCKLIIQLENKPPCELYFCNIRLTLWLAADFLRKSAKRQSVRNSFWPSQASPAFRPK